jgi:hypothetical protein
VVVPEPSSGVKKTARKKAKTDPASVADPESAPRKKPARRGIRLKVEGETDPDAQG